MHFLQPGGDNEDEEDLLDLSYKNFARSTAILCFFLSGCAQSTAQTGPPPGLAAAPCTPGVCTIQVFVDQCNSPNGIRLDKPLVEVTNAVNMRWQIATPGFEFDTNGIQFEPPNAQFVVQNSPKPSEFRVQNKKAQAGDFYYFVSIKGCVRHDPWVRNR